LFIVTALLGILLVLLFFKKIIFTNALTYLGQNTIPLLALQLRAMTIIKYSLLSFGVLSFNFDEPTKFVLTVVQILLIIPIIIFVNRYIPILNGRTKK
jgi:acyltransferase